MNDKHDDASIRKVTVEEFNDLLAGLKRMNDRLDHFFNQHDDHDEPNCPSCEVRHAA